jgi:hypothetical protein
MKQEDIRRAAFEEAAEFVRKAGMEATSVARACVCAVVAKEILALGESEPKPDPRSRRITVTFTVTDKWTYVFDRDSPTQVQRYVTEQVGLGKRSGGLLDPEGDILLYALEQEREKLVVREAHYGQSDEDAARLEHLNLFLDAG